MGDLKYNIAENVEIELTNLKDGLILVRTVTYTDAYDKKPKIQEVIIDTKNECCLIGNTAKILLKIAEGRGFNG